MRTTGYCHIPKNVGKGKLCRIWLRLVNDVVQLKKATSTK